MMSRSLVIAIAITIPGCAGLLGPRTEPARFDDPVYESLAADRAATPPASVKILTAFNLDDELPEGVALVGGDHLETTPGFPTAGDAHQVLGILRLTRRGESPSFRTQREQLAYIGQVQEDAQARLAAAAAAHGANAVFIRQNGRAFAAQALYLSASGATYPRAQELLAKVAAPAGHVRASTWQRSLDAFEPIPVSGPAGTCYTLVFALDEDARLARRTRNGVYLTVRTDDPHLGEVSHATPIFNKTRSHVMEVGCISKQAATSFGVRPSGGPKSTELGQGRVAVHVYTRQLGGAEVAAMVKRRQDSWLRTRRGNCRECYYLRVRCGKPDERDCPEYVRCLASRGETYQTCEAMQP